MQLLNLSKKIAARLGVQTAAYTFTKLYMIVDGEQTILDLRHWIISYLWWNFLIHL